LRRTLTRHICLIKEAVDYINYAKTTSINHPIITWNDILDFSMTRSLPHGFYVDMIEPQVQEMLQQNQGMMDGLIQCFDSYINNGFSIASTARNAYLHRNTVMKRMRKLHKLTGFDPMGDFQSVLINKLILQQYMLELEKGLVSS
jgi:sugar diacid utilization regulator